MAHRPSFPRSVAFAAAVAAVVLATSRPVAAQDVEQQVELSVLLLELSVEEWRERNAAAAAAGFDDANPSAALVLVEKKFGTERARLYRSYFTTAADHLAFFGKYSADVDEYLAEHPGINGRIQALNRTLRELIGIEESQADTTAGGRQ